MGGVILHCRRTIIVYGTMAQNNFTTEEWLKFMTPDDHVCYKQTERNMPSMCTDDFIHSHQLAERPTFTGSHDGALQLTRAARALKRERFRVINGS